MMQKVFIDTNIVLDWLGNRVPFHASAKDLFLKGESKEVEILISTMSFISTEYILRKQLGKEKTRLALSAIKDITTVCYSGEKVIMLAIFSAFSDFEDAFQYYTALENGAEFIITRDPKGFSLSEIPAISAEEFLKFHFKQS
jgi:predicted nucleic acid-binding protein